MNRLNRLNRLFMALFLLLTGSATVAAQSSAINGSIEGVVKDATGAFLPGVSVTATNIATGLSRTVATNDTGLYRAQLLPLGPYRVEAELAGFKKFTQEGVELAAGRTAVVNITLELGAVAETVTVSADSPVVEPAKIDLGRVLNEREIQNIPLVSRNPYNFALLQANVTGYENEEFGVPRINANGTQMRTNYQFDGNTNMQVDRAGLRITPASEIFVKEVNLVTSGFAPEFGQTTGMVYNIVSPSGSNDIKGNFSYRFQRKDFASRPFFLSPTAPKPDTHVNTFTGSVGGPLKRDKWHYYFGYEKVGRDLSADRVITVSPANAARLGIGQALGDGVIPTDANAHFVIAKTDYQVNPQNHLSFRYSLFDQVVADNIGGGLNTLEQSLDFDDRVDSFSGQLISTVGADRLNELRVSWIKRNTERTPSEFTGPGPAITVSGVANFGGTTGLNDFEESIFQVVDSFSLYRGNHAFKFGANLQFIKDFRQEPVFSAYTFASIDDYLAARDGLNPFSYTQFRQAVGDPTLDINSSFFGFFFQDDWAVSPSFKLLYGVRYDVFDLPEAAPFALNPASSDFRVDKNNWAPRVGVSWDIGSEGRSVLTAHTGIMYDTPLIMFYQDAILSNGDPRFQTFTLNRTSPGAPAFPNNLIAAPGFTRPSTIRTVSPDFANYYTVQSTVQFRRALSSDMSFEIAYVNAEGRNLPVVRDVNLINPVGQLADGRPVFSTAVNAATRANPEFNHILQVDPNGESSYNAITFRVNRRFSHGLQFNSFYTLAKAEDDAPLGGRYVVGSTDPDLPSDPTDNRRDRGATPFDVRHTWITSGVWSLLTNTQIGFVLNFNSGLPFTIFSNRDVNGDGVANNDRPAGVERQSGRLGWYRQVDLRFSQFIPFGGRYRAEIFGDFTNLFNTENVRAVNSTVAIDALGNASAAIPADENFPRTGGYLQTRFQLGFKLYF